MAIGDPYATKDELKDYLKLTAVGAGSEFDARLSDAVDTASREIEKICNRQFNKATSATQRVYRPMAYQTCRVDDFWTTSGLIVETDMTGDGIFEVTWAANEYELYPLNGITDGQPGWPYNKMRATLGKYFPINKYGPGTQGWAIGNRATVRVTAQWGWSAVPSPIHQACLIMAAETYELKSAPLGVAGFGDFGVVRVRTNPMALSKLQRYKSDPVLVG